jgi:chaperonin GroES
MKSLSVAQLKPMAGYVLVEPAKSEQKTVSGIILPENDSEKPQYGKVLAVGEPTCGSCCEDSCCDDRGGCCGGGCCGEGCCDDDKNCEDKGYCEPKTDKVEACCEVELKKGDMVVYKKWGGNEVMIDDVEYQFLKFEDILAVVK